MAVTSFTATALIGTAPALEAQAIASPAARLRKEECIAHRYFSSEVPVGNDGAFLQFHMLQRGARLIRWALHGGHI